MTRAAGASEIVLDPIVTRPSRHLYWGSVTDITYEPSAWVNRCFARFAGLDSVRLVTPLEDGSSTVIGPEHPIVLEDGVVVSSVLFSRRHDCLTIVDTVTSLGGTPLLVDDWDLDAVYSGTQKCLSCVPGLSPVTFSERALERIDVVDALPDERAFAEQVLVDI